MVMSMYFIAFGRLSKNKDYLICLYAISPHSLKTLAYYLA